MDIRLENWIPTDNGQTDNQKIIGNQIMQMAVCCMISCIII